MNFDDLDAALLGFFVDEDSLLWAIAHQLDREGYMVARFRDGALHSISITPAGRRILRLLAKEDF